MSEMNGQRLPTGWAKAAIEDIFAPLEYGRTLHQGWSPQCEKGPSKTEEEWGVLRTTAIQPGAFFPEQNKRLPAGLAPRPQIEVKPGDILLTCAGPRSRCGIACLVRSTRKKLMMSGKMYRFRVPEEYFDARFLEAFLQTSAAYDSIDRMKTGGSDSGLNLTHDRFRQLEVPVAPLNEQRRIVETYEELISDLDAGAAALERARAKLKLYRASVLKAAVEGAITAEWRERHPQTEPASELLKRILAERRRRWEQDQLAKFKAKNQEPPKNWKAKYKEPVAPDTANLPPLPEGWCWASFDQIGETQGGLQKSPNRKPIKNHYPYLRVANVHRGSLDLHELHRFELTKDELERLRLEPGDILIVEGNGSRTEIGRCAMWRGEVADCVHQNHIIRVRPLAGAIPKYINIFLNSPDGQKAIQWVASSTSGLYTLSIGKIEKLPLSLPPTDEQEAIVEAVEDQLSVIEHLEADLDAKLKNARALRQAILRHAFTGQLVPQDPNDEPASELLKRIAAERESHAREAADAKRADKKTNGSRVTRHGRPKKTAQGPA